MNEQKRLSEWKERARQIHPPFAFICRPADCRGSNRLDNWLMQQHTCWFKVSFLQKLFLNYQDVKTALVNCCTLKWRPVKVTVTPSFSVGALTVSTWERREFELSGKCCSSGAEKSWRWFYFPPGPNVLSWLSFLCYLTTFIHTELNESQSAFKERKRQLLQVYYPIINISFKKQKAMMC